MADPSERASSREGGVKQQAKPPFDELVESLKQATAKAPRVGLREVKRLLKRGFAQGGDSASVAKVADLLEGYDAADRWAISVATIERPRVSRTFQQKLLEEMSSRFARRIGMFDLILDGPSIRQEIQAWVFRSAQARGITTREDKSVGQEATSESQDSPVALELTHHRRLRWAFVWLVLRLSAERRDGAILTLIESWAESEKKISTGRSAGSRWNRFVAGVLIAEKPKSNRITPLLDALASLRAQVSSCLDREQAGSRELARVREELETEKQKADGIRDELVGAHELLEKNRATITELERRLVDADERYKSLDEHWKRSSTTNLARKVGSLSEEVGHEVQEAILSLDRESPNVAMALSRLRRLDGIVKRQTRGNLKEE